MKVSKVVLVVVALHVLVIGGIFVFEGCSRAKTPESQLAGNSNQPSDTTTATTPVADTNLVSATPSASTPAPAPSLTTTPAPSTSLVATAPVVPATAPATTKVYTVKKGDSLYKIAKAEKITVEQLAQANNLSKTSKLQIDQKLNIPAPVVIAKTTPAAAPITTVSATMLTPSATGIASASAPSGAGNVYEVKSGDSLWKIAKNNGVTVAALKQANNLTKDALKVGQKLTIPAKGAVAPVTTAALTSDPNQPVCVVGPNDTIASIAKTYGVKVEDLLKANGMTATSGIPVGKKLLIPVAAPAVPTAPASAAPAVIAPSLIVN